MVGLCCSIYLRMLGSLRLIEELKTRAYHEAEVDRSHLLPQESQSTHLSYDASNLSRRELEVLQLVAEGWETSRMAGQLGISRHTVRNHIRNLRHKLGASSKLDAVVKRSAIGHHIRTGVAPIASSSEPGILRRI